jgi:hypothetical protein
MAKKSRKTSKSARKTTTRSAKARSVQPGFTAVASGLVKIALGIGPKLRELPETTVNELDKLFPRRKYGVVEGCGTTMAPKYIIICVPGPKK